MIDFSKLEDKGEDFAKNEAEKRLHQDNQHQTDQADSPQAEQPN